MLSVARYIQYNKFHKQSQYLKPCFLLHVPKRSPEAHSISEGDKQITTFLGLLVNISSPPKNCGIFRLHSKFVAATCNDLDQQQYALQVYAAWLARAILRRAGIEANTSHSAAHSAQLALTSEPVNCTVGTPSSCKTGGSKN